MRCFIYVYDTNVVDIFFVQNFALFSDTEHPFLLNITFFLRFNVTPFSWRWR